MTDRGPSAGANAAAPNVCCPQATVLRLKAYYGAVGSICGHIGNEHDVSLMCCRLQGVISFQVSRVVRCRWVHGRPAGQGGSTL